MQRIWIALTTMLLLGGCASSMVSLNDPGRSFMAPDLANLLDPRDIPYEIKEVDGIEVGYSLMFSNADNSQGYRLTLVFRNKGKEPRVISPIVALEDASKIQIPAYAYESFVTNGAVLSGTRIPAISVSQPSSYYSIGTIRNTSTGNSFAYSGTTSSAPYGAAGGFASGFAQGIAQGAAVKAQQDREDGLLMMRWANAYWLKNTYSLQPGSGAVGALFFPSPKIGELPLNLKIELSGQTAVFNSVEKLSK